MSRSEEYVRDANASLETAYEEPMSLTAFVDRLFERPNAAAHAPKYLLDAIESAGTRTVVEEGERKERFRFFDDPYNDGEHAVLGNTDVLNDFVDDLRSIAAGRGKVESILWFTGPTATGKSEFKRCLINGLREYSKNPEGRRYTIEWNLATLRDGRGLSYNDESVVDEDDWFESPVGTNPLAVLPADVRRRALADLNETVDDDIPVGTVGDLDPFSREAYDRLETVYRRRGTDGLFSKIADEKHLRVKNYVVDLGRGIGVLHAEDDGTPKERLVGSWMPGMLRELDSRGRKNPQAFSYDGVLSQGNGGLAIVEDASQHADLLGKLLNVPEERTVKLDRGIAMEVDTQLLIISNPDLEAQLNRQAERGDEDPLRALKRRLDRREFRYLTNLGLEVELLRRELTDETAVWAAEDYEELDARLREPLTLRIRTEAGTVVDRELAPHALKAAALYAVITRLDAEDLPAGLDLTDKALLFDRGYLESGDERLEKGDLEFDPDASDGETGMPVTYTRDVIAGLLQEPRDRNHPSLPVGDVVMPRDVVDAMVDGLPTAPMFSADERERFADRATVVRNHLCRQQERDVVEAMMREVRVDEATVSEYVEHVFAWANDGAVKNDRGEAVDPDPLTMKVFEVKHLGRFGDEHYEGTAPTDPVESFRREKIITAINRHTWEHRDETFAAGDVDLSTIPVIRRVLETYDWSDVARTYRDLDPDQWADPPAGTETATVKARTIENMVDLFGYSEAAAELTSRYVMGQVSYQWD